MKISVRVSPETRAYTSGEWQFGWELEAIASKRDYRGKVNVRNVLDSFFPHPGKVGDDTTIETSGSQEFGFEYKNGPFPVTPAILKALLTSLNALPGQNIRTNHSCGFHVHFSHANLNDNDIRWILIGLSLDESGIRDVTRFEGITFENTKYADTQFLGSLGELVRKFAETRDPNLLSEITGVLDKFKYRVFRLHPQGTLEWRGPRTFLDTPSPKVNAMFVHRIHKVVRLLDRLLQQTDVLGVSRKDFRIGETFGGRADTRQMKDRAPFDFLYERSRFNELVKREDMLNIYSAVPWLKDAKFSDAWVEIRGGKLVWHDGTWEDGKWVDGTWEGGVWENGVWINGGWEDGVWHMGRDKSGVTHTNPPSEWT